MEIMKIKIDLAVNYQWEILSQLLNHGRLSELGSEEAWSEIQRF